MKSRLEIISKSTQSRTVPFDSSQPAMEWLVSDGLHPPEKRISQVFSSTNLYNQENE